MTVSTVATRRVLTPDARRAMSLTSLSFSGKQIKRYQLSYFYIKDELGARVLSIKLVEHFKSCGFKDFASRFFF